MTRTTAEVLIPPEWSDYELLDSGMGAKLERFGEFVLARPEQQAIWRRGLPDAEWRQADAVFEKADGGEGTWTSRRPIPDTWPMQYGSLRFAAQLTPFRHTGVFPEQAAHWDWIDKLVRGAGWPVRVLDLFGYTALASLAAAAAGANVTYVDASRPALTWARENQRLSGLDERPIRWILDDALKFVRREARRGVKYDAIIMDPPVFGRGPKGEVWRFFTSFPPLLEACRSVLAPEPLFVLINAYAVEASPLLLANALDDLIGVGVGAGREGEIQVGDLALEQKRPGRDSRLLPTGIYGRWSRGERR